MVTAGLNAIVALGVYVTYLSGQASLAHAAFMGMGAYASAVLTTNFGAPFPLAILIGTLVGFVGGSLLSFVTMRMGVLVVALTTLGFGETMVILAFNTEYLGGAQSFSGIPAYTNIGMVYVALALVLFVTWRLDHSRIGLAARAIRDSRITAAAMGINVTWIRMTTFGLGAAMAALGGTLSAHYVLVVNPEDMTFFRSFGYKILVLFGGSHTFLGPLVGAIVLTFLPEALRLAFSLSEAFSQSLRFTAYGLIVMLVVLWRPQGIVTRVPTGVPLRSRLRRKVLAAAEPAPVGGPLSAGQARASPAGESGPGGSERDHA